MGYVSGFAYASADVIAARKAVAATTAGIDRGAAIVSRTSGYHQNCIVLDPALTAGLTDEQKICLADDFHGPFGGSVNGNTVIVYTD